MKKHNSEKILKFVAIITIYLIISLIFFTARTFAILNYDIRGEGGASGFARSDNDFITLDVNASSNVSFESGTLGSIPITGCVATDYGVSCTQLLEPTTIEGGIESVSFMLAQSSGVPESKSGILYIDSTAPNHTQLSVDKAGSGLNFTYTFRDYLSSEDEGDTCKGSGIGYVEIRFQGRVVFAQSITTKNCTISGSYFLDLAGTRTDSASYSIIVKDRAGNEYNSGPVTVSGDFKTPMISETFKILRSGVEVYEFSTTSEITADIVVEVEEANISNVYGNLSDINTNPAIRMNPDYQKAYAGCVLDSGNLYICTFKDKKIRPSDNTIEIKITATDDAGNMDEKTLRKTFTIMDSAGGVLYLGPAKEHCTSDLNACYVRTGRQLLYVELDKSSSYNQSIVNIGINSDRTFSICRLNNTWKCTGVYDIDSSANMFIAESYDDYGNMLESELERILYLDDTKPKNISALQAFNSNNNNNCSVSADELQFRINISEETPELRVYVNTSEFTSQQIQRGTCDKLENGNYECVLTVEGFSSVESSKIRDVTFEDLAGNILKIPYKFEVCKSTSDKVPNVIFEVTPSSVSKIDRRTANKISVKTYIPLSLKVDSRATLMYLNIERCVAIGVDGLNVMGTGHSLLPAYGNSPTLALYIGHSGAVLPENSLEINCTMSARVKIGRTVYLQEERQDFTLKIDTYDNELGTIDRSTAEEINGVRENLRYLDKKIKSWEDSIGWLGNICSIAETLGNVNTVLQIVKSAVYGVLAALNIAFPELNELLNTIWKAVYGTFHTFHSIVTEYVWPPGIIPGKGDSISPGTVVKWICLLYNCKHYDAGTLIQITTELTSRYLQDTDKQPTSEGYGQAETDKAEVYTDSNGNEVKGVYRDSQGNMVTKDGQYIKDVKVGDKTIRVVTDSTGKPIDSKGNVVSYETGKAVPVPPVDGKPVKATGDLYGVPSDFEAGMSSTTLDGVKEAPKELIGEDAYWDELSHGSYSASFSSEDITVTITPAEVQQNAQAINAQREMLINALGGHSWIIDPYRSIHYDGLCIPAYIYNLKKERQIECMYLSCLEGQDGLVPPKIMCDGNYKVNKCLYLDSAEWVLSGSHFWESFVKGLWDSFENTALSIAITFVYKRFCKEDYSVPKTIKKIKGARLASDWRAAICGVTGSIFAARELVDAFKNPFTTAPMFGTGRSAGEVDYCEGLDYQTEYAADGSTERWFDE